MTDGPNATPANSPDQRTLVALRRALRWLHRRTPTSGVRIYYGGEWYELRVTLAKRDE